MVMVTFSEILTNHFYCFYLQLMVTLLREAIQEQLGNPRECAWVWRGEGGGGGGGGGRLQEGNSNN